LNTADADRQREREREREQDLDISCAIVIDGATLSDVVCCML